VPCSAEFFSPRGFSKPQGREDFRRKSSNFSYSQGISDLFSSNKKTASEAAVEICDFLLLHSILISRFRAEIVFVNCAVFFSGMQGSFIAIS
jgi:hypothetical protein